MNLVDTVVRILVRLILNPASMAVLSFVLTLMGKMIVNASGLRRGGQERARAIYDVFLLGPPLSLVGFTALYGASLATVSQYPMRAIVLSFTSVVAVMIFIGICLLTCLMGEPADWTQPTDKEVVSQRLVPTGLGFLGLGFDLIVVMLLTM